MEETRIMVVEDEEISGTFINYTLQQQGYVVTSVESTASGAIMGAQRDKPDLILMDIQIDGEMDGIEAAFEIRSRFNIPVVYLTVHADEATLNRAKITEPFGYIVKPFESRELKINIEMALYKHKMEDKLRGLAHYDYLTGLPNRALFFDRFDQILKQAKRSGRDMAVLMIDLDGFKCINDAMGHDAGDNVLVEVGRRLKHQIRDSDTLARLGGDEFVIVLTNLSDRSDTETLALKILVALGRPFHFNGTNCSIGASIGISLYPLDGSDTEVLMKKADAAMYRAKEKGKNNYQLFNDLHKSFSGDIKTALSQSLKFVSRYKSNWGNSDWIEFLIALRGQGFPVSRTIEPYLGAIVKTLQKFTQLHPPMTESIEETLFDLCSEAADFITSNDGIWTVQQWQSFVDSLKAREIELDENTASLFYQLIEPMKSLYILCC